MGNVFLPRKCSNVTIPRCNRAVRPFIGKNTVNFYERVEPGRELVSRLAEPEFRQHLRRR